MHRSKGNEVGLWIALTAFLLSALACNDSLTAPKPKLTLNTASATLASGGAFAYVANSFSNTVSVIATATNTVVATVAVGLGPYGVAITPNGAFAYVTNGSSNTVSVIATATNTVVATVAVGLYPLGVAITPNGAFAYVTNASSNTVSGTVSVIATATNTVVATVAVGLYPASVAITPDGAFAYVTNGGSPPTYKISSSNTVSVIATATNTVVATVAVGLDPFGVAITPNGAFAYVTNSVSNTVSVIATATNTVVATVSVGSSPFGVAITPNGAFAYVPSLDSRGSSFPNIVSVIATATNTVVATVAAGYGPIGVAITPDGAFAYVTNNFSNTVSVIATATNTVVATVAVGSYPIGVAITPQSPPIANAGGPYTGYEGAAVTFNGTGSSDPNGGALTYSWNFGDGSALGTGATPSHTYLDNGTYTVTLTVSNSTSSSTASTTATIANVAPTVGTITTAPAAPVPVNTTITASASFTDPGTLDTHTAVFNWGDGTSSAGAVTETSGSGTASGTHIYTTAGVYTITLTVTDKDGGTGQSVFEFVVVYDPAAGFVTGGGWINSPAGAYVADPTLTGRANFGFVSRYQTGATVPSGNTKFEFQDGNLNFKSTSYDWLVIAGAQAKYKGSGTINGAGDFGFLLSAVDGEVSGGGGTDKFRIKIWDKGTGTVIYDNQLGATDDAAATTVIGGGDIVIHN